MTPLAYGISDAANVMGVGKTTVYELIGTGKLQAKKIGSRTVIPAESLMAFMARLPDAKIRTGRTDNT